MCQTVAHHSPDASGNYHWVRLRYRVAWVLCTLQTGTFSEPVLGTDEAKHQDGRALMLLRQQRLCQKQNMHSLQGLN